MPLRVSMELNGGGARAKEDDRLTIIPDDDGKEPVAEFFFASDAAAIVVHTNKVTYLRVSLTTTIILATFSMFSETTDAVYSVDYLK